MEHLTVADRDAPAGPAPSVYEMIRDDIVAGRLAPNERLKATSLAARYGTSNNPIREALQQLRGEGFVVITPNRGARVRPMDGDFVRDISHIEMLLEPYFTRWFVDVATRSDIERLEAIQARIEELAFADRETFSLLDTQFHWVFYERHFNTHALDMWWRHRDILGALSRHNHYARWREEAIIDEHRRLIEAVKRHDADEAARVVEMHVRGSGKHLIEQMQAKRPTTAAPRQSQTS